MNDRKGEVDALSSFIGEHGIELVQLRNLNIDPALINALVLPDDDIMGIGNMLKFLKKKNKGVKFGYFNRVRDDFYR
jgi:hypothetical protein